jgi:hypothetical protein
VNGSVWNLKTGRESDDEEMKMHLALRGPWILFDLIRRGTIYFVGVEYPVGSSFAS